jgi:hypothetical protein
MIRIGSRLSCIMLSISLAGCSGQFTTNMPPTQVAPTATPVPAASVVPSPEPATAMPPQPTEAVPLATEEPTTVPEPIAAPIVGPELRTVPGQVVLQLSNGSGDGQVGIATSDTFGYEELVGADAFRIGSDGSIRVLDSVNKRLLFFSDGGQLVRTNPISEAQNPIDFIVDPQGQIYVFDRGVYSRETLLWDNGQVLRYAPDGSLSETIAVAPQVAADGILRTANDDLLLVQGNQRFWTIIRDGVVAPAAIQPLTIREGSATPRSPVIFRVGTDETKLWLSLTDLAGAPLPLGTPDIALPPTSFFNVDRAMNLYFAHIEMLSGGQRFNTWRVAPEGTVEGGGHVDYSACERINWRSFYIDQSGAAWSLCVTRQGATISRYDLVDLQGMPFPPAPDEPSELASWRPGVPIEFTAA